MADTVQYVSAKQRRSFPSFEIPVPTLADRPGRREMPRPPPVNRPWPSTTSPASRHHHRLQCFGLSRIICAPRSKEQPRRSVQYPIPDRKTHSCRSLRLSSTNASVPMCADKILGWSCNTSPGTIEEHSKMWVAPPTYVYSRQAQVGRYVPTVRYVQRQLNQFSLVPEPCRCSRR